ncbi:MAG: phytanoyl-CoA dioxygenase family protein [Microthrixaceae bacterium]|nr:phytanoyl-CoA dioxygenase family protein [Microthrixaceae bacterium]
MSLGPPISNSALVHDGYCVVDRVGSGLLDQLYELYTTRTGNPEGFQSSARDGAPAERLRLHRSIQGIVEPELDRHFGPGVTAFLNAFLVKHRAAEAVSFHQDLTYTDESVIRSYSAWIPLVDVESRSGAMRVVPGSHRWTSGIRAAGPTGTVEMDAISSVLDERAITIEMSAGSILVWDSATIHASHPNRSSAERVAVASAFVVGAVPLRFCFADAAEGLRAYEFDERVLAGRAPFRTPPASLPRVEPWAELVDGRGLLGRMCSGK